MKSLSILHLGDVHYPDHKDVRDEDAKDDGFPAALRKSVTRNKLSGAITKAARINSTLAPVIMICGDITSLGDPDAYRSGVSTLRDALGLDTTTPADQWHVAIGNHDLDRHAVDPNTPGITQYEFAVAAWQPHDVLAIERPRTTSYTRNDATLQLTTLNSCVGSGAHRNLPTKVRTQVADAAKDALDSATTGSVADDDVRKALELVYEELDTPGFDAEHMVELVEIIRTLDHSTVPIVLAHHNLLPQGTPRFAAYTELVNGGQVRGQLASCPRPVIYLHGHIHEDAIELVERHGEGRGKLLLISAPLLVDGFNLVTVEFSDAGRLLGVIVKRYRSRHGGDVDADPTEVVRIPLVDVALPRNNLLPTVAKVLAEIGHSRFPRLVTEVSKADPDATDDAVADAVIEGQWAGQFDVLNREEADRKLWSVVNLDLI